MQEEPRGFILSDAAVYAYECQEVFSDLISFAAAIPDHLKPLFLIPVVLDPVSPADMMGSIASRVASRIASPSGDTPEGDLFSVKTFVNYDTEPGVPTGEEDSSIFDVDYPLDRAKHQENPLMFDENITPPSDTSFNSDVDLSESGYEGYPYRSDLVPGQTRHSVLITKIAIKPEVLQQRAPVDVKGNAKACDVNLVSYDKPSRVYTFSVGCGKSPHTVKASLSDIDEVAMSCDCGFWRWNGPEFHAKGQDYMLGNPRGTASPPDVRDPDRKYWLCKHTYAVLRRLDNFVSQVVEENWDMDDKELLDVVDKEWDRLEGASQVPLEDIEEEDPTLEVVALEEEPETEDDKDDLGEDDLEIELEESEIEDVEDDTPGKENE